MAGTITHKWNGTVLTITSDSGTTSCDLKGDKGDTGIRGPQGIAGEPGKAADVDLSNYPTKTETMSAIQNVQLKVINTQNELSFHTLARNPHKTTAADIGALTANDLKGYATEQYVDSAIANLDISGVDIDLSNYYTKSETQALVEDAVADAATGNVDLSAYATKKYVDNAIAAIDVGSGGTTTDLPAYWTTHMTSKAADINDKLYAAGVRKSSFFWYTDAHWTTNYGSTPALLRYLNKYTSINKTNFGGDIAQEKTGELNTLRTSWRAAIRDIPNHHSVIGNHDNQIADLPIPDGATKPTAKNKYAFLIAPEETADMVLGTDANDGCLYYYIDNPTEKTRYMYLSTGRMWAYKHEVEFFANALKNTPAGWHIIGISHIWLNSDYSGSTPTVLTTPPSYSKVFMDLFDAYNKRTNSTITNSELGISVACDFTSAAAKVEFLIGGHIHKDYDFITDGGIPVILTECDGYGERCDDCAAVKGTNTENCVYAIIADYDNDIVNVISVGRGLTRYVGLADGTSTPVEPDEPIVPDEPTNYTNVLKTSIDADGNIYNGIGYKENTRINSSFVETTATGWDLTGYIAIKEGDIVRFKNMTFYDIDNTGGDYKRNSIIGYDASFNYITKIDGVALGDNWYPVLDGNGDLIQFTQTTAWENSVAYIRICAKDINANSVITINEEID